MPLGRIGLYDLLLPVGALAMAPGYLIRSLRRPEYREHFSERCGILPAELESRLRHSHHSRVGPVWIQAVSVGEVSLARAILGAMQRRVVVSSTTPAGRAAAAGISSPLLEGVFHFPIDWFPFVRRTLDTVRPALFVSMETEIWPGLLRECGRRGIPVVMVNGRISKRSHDRYLRFHGLFREPLQAVRLACMQSETDAARIRAIGVPPDRVVVTGNMKFDAGTAGGGPSTALRESLASRAPGARGASGDRVVLVAGSTSPGEEEMVLDALGMVEVSCSREVALVLAPRHPERFDEVARLMERRGVAFVRRSMMGDTPGPSFKVLLLDTLGELAGLYALASVAFVGGSLVPRGGQNMIEPAAHGVPVLFGPHTGNFDSVATELIQAGAGFRVTSAADLAAAWRSLIADEPLRRRAGDAGRALVESHKGATRRTLEHLLPLLPERGKDD